MAARVGLGRNDDPTPDLAVDLHRHLDFLVLQERRVVGGPGLVGQGLVMAENLPEFLGKMRRQGRKQQREGLHRRSGDEPRPP